ncbi:MAG: hypothetical protein Q4C96_11065 [Planctomycetia bacterium]|nr:hypothetical protein [Planctomycetia bacterium]
MKVETVTPPKPELKDPYVATFLTLIFPGLGHFYQGRIGKGILFAFCVGMLFFIGACLGSSAKYGPCRVVYFSLRPDDTRYYYFAQMWIGLPAFPAVVQYMVDPSGKEPVLGGLMAPPIIKNDHVRQTERGLESDSGDAGGQLPTVDNIREELNRKFELGTIFTVVAGLLNIFVLMDAAYGPFPPPKEDEAEKKSEKNKN